MSESSLGPVSEYVRARLAALLNERRVVVWYDPDRAFSSLLDRLQIPGCAIISAAGSRLRARRDAEAVYRQLNKADGSAQARMNLLIYIPSSRGKTTEQQQQDPFEAFARCGATFGDKEADGLMSLAQLALPDRAAEIARLFRDGRPTLALLDALPATARFPLVRQALGTESPVDVVVAAFTSEDTEKKLLEVDGSLTELNRLVQTWFGLPPGAFDNWQLLRDRLATYLLVSELDFDLPDGLPAAFTNVPHAENSFMQNILAVCERVRESDAGREMYFEFARVLEGDLHLASVLGPETRLGSRDTFPLQDRLRLMAVIRAAKDGDLAAARSLLEQGERTVWRHDPERGVIWQLVQRCLTFLDLAAAAETKVLPSDIRALVEAYTARDGIWQLDRAQRLYEQADALSIKEDEVEPLVQLCRARYRAVVERVQSTFQAAVRADGWPPEGIRRQAQVFETFVAPELTERRKTAFFMVDSLRYEMGRDLADVLQEIGSVSAEGVASVLPTTTSFGMAALLPGADGALTFVEHHGDLLPAIGGVPMPGPSERRAAFASRYGDRFIDIAVEEILSISPKRLATKLGTADLVVVRAQGIDALGEGPSLFRARKVMGEVIGELQVAANRLAVLGFQTLVFSADHGHVLVPEILAGDVLSIPPGQWMMKKRRSLLGTAQKAVPGVLTLRAQDVGIVGPVNDFVAAAGFKTFQEGTGYFHEGVSLQECVIPVIVVRVQRAQAAGGNEQVSITYRSDRFTSSVVGLKLLLTSMFSTSLSIRLEAFDGSGPKAKSVGQAADCDARDPATGEISLKSGEETQVPLVVDPDFQGPSIEVRAIDPHSGVTLARLTLKNARMD